VTEVQKIKKVRTALGVERRCREAGARPPLWVRVLLKRQRGGRQDAA
jgi:hypothetical protein